MGRDKALLPWGGTDLLGHTLARLRAVSDDVRILSGVERRHVERGVPVVTDPSPNLGPMGGLWAALEASEGRRAFLLGVDLPLVPITLLAGLVALAANADAAVPVSPHGPEPLCAVYGPGCLPAVHRAVERGDLKMTAFWPDVRVRPLGPEQLAAFGSPDELFLNVNSPEDYEEASKVARR